MFQDVQVVTDDGSPAGRKDFIIWQPPLLDEMAPEVGRVRSMTEGCALFIFLLKRGIRTIVFCQVTMTSITFLCVGAHTSSCRSVERASW
jgi:DEAD/DEAH box helicase domain-containing protein